MLACSPPTRKLSSPIKVICPPGGVRKILSSPLRKNIPLVPSGKSRALIRASFPTQGALANVINEGWDAVDAEALLDEQRGRGRRSRVVLTPRRRRQVFA